MRNEIRIPNDKVRNRTSSGNVFGFRISSFGVRSYVIPLLLPLFLLASLLPSLGQRNPVPRPVPLNPVQAEKEGRALVANLLAQKPAENLTNSGTLRVRDAKGKQREQPVSFAIIAAGSNWQSIYESQSGAGQSGGQ